ncbi:hypothetical protein ACFYST_08270 [Kitasatospora sp. NPDC004614]|uniref:hypothetical protein n=1 Tax=unclassified Kitasatospora TaxID=2633591 RepID=UPI0036B5E757
MSAYRRSNRPRDTGNQRDHRITATWPTGPRPVLFSSPDRRRVLRVARKLADAGAVVLIEEHLGGGAWRLLQRLDGPAILRQRRATEQALAETARQVEADLLAAQADHRQTAERERQLDAVAAVMVQPPVPRDGGNPRARTVARGKGIR